MSADAQAPHRVHPLTMLPGLVRRATSTAILPPIVLVIWGKGIGLILLALAGAGAYLIVSAWLDWWSLSYRVADDELVVQHGLVRRSRRSIPLERIQDMSFEQGVFGRLFGLVVVKVDTGGGQAEEARLDSVAMAEALRLRALVRKTPAEADRAEAPSATPEQQLLFAMPLGRVLLHGLFSFSFVWLAAIFGVIHSLDRFLDFDWERVLGTAEEVAVAQAGVATIATLIVLVLVFGMVTGVVRSVARDYGFRLVHGLGRFRRMRGLLTRSELVIDDRRIQLGLVRRGAVSGRLGWCAVDVQTLGGSEDSSGREELVPFGTAEEAATVIAAAGLPQFDRGVLVRVARAHILCSAVRHSLPILLVTGAAGFFLPQLWFGLLLVPVPVVVALFQREHHRYAMRDSSVQIMRGVLGQRDWIVPYGSVQAVIIRRGWLQRRLGVATVQIDTAGASGWHRPDVADIFENDAVDLAHTLIARA